jgi:hypothetical protein
MKVCLFGLYVYIDLNIKPIYGFEDGFEDEFPNVFGSITDTGGGGGHKY